MNLTEIAMDTTAARRAFIEYRQAFRDHRQDIDGELMRAYRALSLGKRLIRLTETISAGGVDSMGRPRLAICRADEPVATFERWSDGRVSFSPVTVARAADRVITLPPRTLPVQTADQPFSRGWPNWEAIAPIIPPRFRPPIRIENFHLLWEAEWTEPRQRRAPGDPALLRHLGGDLWAVVAVWDLTPIERAVLEMRR